MATVTMELAELDMLKRDAEETKQKLNNKIEELKKENATLVNNCKKILVRKEVTHTRQLLPVSYFYSNNKCYDDIRLLKNGNSIYFYGNEYKYNDDIKCYISVNEKETSIENQHFIGFEEAKERLESAVIFNLKQENNSLKNSVSDLKEIIKNYDYEKNKEISLKIKNTQKIIDDKYKDQLSDKDDKINNLENQLKKEQEKFAQYKAKVEQDEERMAKDDLIEKLRKEVSTLKQKLSKSKKKSWIIKMFSEDIEE